MGFAHHTFLLCLSSVSLFYGMGRCEDFTMPDCAVGSELLPMANIDVRLLEESFEATFVAFLLPSN